MMPKNSLCLDFFFSFLIISTSIAGRNLTLPLFLVKEKKYFYNVDPKYAFWGHEYVVLALNMSPSYTKPSVNTINSRASLKNNKKRGRTAAFSVLIGMVRKNWRTSSTKTSDQRNV